MIAIVIDQHLPRECPGPNCGLSRPDLASRRGRMFYCENKVAPKRSPSAATMCDRSSRLNFAASSMFTMWPVRGKAATLVLGITSVRNLLAGAT